MTCGSTPSSKAQSPLAYVTIPFASVPGARTAWHSHARGQTLYVVGGVGLVQSRESEIAEIRRGDIISTPADEWHWHGAKPTNFMTHLSITEGMGNNDRPEADWGGRVTDREYRGR